MRLREQSHALAQRETGEGRHSLRFGSVALPGFLLFGLAFSEAASHSERVNLTPKLQTGQTLTYLIRFQSEKNTKTQSNIVTPATPDPVRTEARGLLRIEILEVKQEAGKATARARSHFQTPSSDVPGKPADQKNSEAGATPPAPEEKQVEFTILGDGQVDEVKGLDELPPEQQLAWQEWSAQFSIAAAFPPSGVKRGEKWKKTEAEKSSTLIAGLGWSKESAYVRDEPCAPMQTAAQDDVAGPSGADEACAVILTTASLTQKSSLNDATPEDFKLHELRTAGKAKGRNEIIAYISLRTGLVVRATEEASQSMDVTVAKTDGSNRVHYNVDATSHAEVLLLTEGSQNTR